MLCSAWPRRTACAALCRTAWSCVRLTSGAVPRSCADVSVLCDVGGCEVSVVARSVERARRWMRVRRVGAVAERPERAPQRDVAREETSRTGDRTEDGHSGVAGAWRAGAKRSLTSDQDAGVERDRTGARARETILARDAPWA